LRLSGKPFIQNFTWQPERGTRFHVLSKDDGQVVTTCKSDAFFVFHHVNAFEQEDEIVVDLVAYPDAMIIDAMYLDKLRSGADVSTGHLRRYRLRLASGNTTYETPDAGDAGVAADQLSRVQRQPLSPRLWHRQPVAA